MTSTPKIKTNYVTNPDHLKTTLQIRKKVFVEEQGVPEGEEWDEFDKEARHFLAFFDDVPCGTARWRFTDKGIKLERFAVLKEFRKKGVGHQLVQGVLADVNAHQHYNKQLIYLNAQVDAMPLYEKSGFKKVGEMFMECNIRHFKMVLEKASDL